MALLGDVDIDVRDESWADDIPDIETLVTLVFTQTLEAVELGDLRPCEISLVLTSDADIATLNAEYRGKEGATNVLSFPSQDFEAAEELIPEPGPLLLGDIVLALETCRREAVAQDKPFADHSTHLLVHGLLHLLGHDHMSDEEAALMESREIAILARLGIANPYESSQT